MEPDSPPNLKEEHAPDYEQRKATHQSKRDKLRAVSRPEPWPVRTGRYTNGIADEQTELMIVNGIELEGMETVIHQYVMNVLSSQKTDNVNKPVVVLDFGGMYGLSMIKLAKATEELVRQGKIAYIVSNLSFNPSKMPKDEIEDLATGLGHADYNDFFLQNRDLVHFIISDAEELKECVLDLPDGNNLSLFGNIDLIHEQNALGKSQILDSDLPTLGKSLSPYGALFLGDKDAVYTVNTAAFELGENNLLRNGVNVLDVGENAHYKVFLKPRSPNISLG